MDRFESDPSWLERLAGLNGVIAEARQPLVGNLFYDHLQEDYLVRPPNPILRAKRVRFRQAIAGRARLLEVGVNGGHSAFLALTSNPLIEVHGVDICEHAYVRPAVDWLKREFPGRVFLHDGDSRDVLPRLARIGWEFDAFHIDGAKFAYFEDIRNCQMMMTPEAVMIVDDCQLDEVARTLNRCARQGRARPLPQFRSMPSSTKYRNEIVTLMPPTIWQGFGLRVLSPIHRLRRTEAVRRIDTVVARQNRRIRSFARHPVEVARRKLERTLLS